MEEVRERQAGVGQTLFAADEIARHERTIGGRHQVRVERVHFPELRTELAGLEQQVLRQRREGDEPFFDFETFGARGQEEIRARVRIDDRLEGGLDFGQLHRRLIAERVLAGHADEVADHGDVRIEHLGRETRRRLRRRRRWLIGRRLCRRRNLSGWRQLKNLQAPGLRGVRIFSIRAFRLPGFQISELRFKRLQPPVVLDSKLLELRSQAVDLGSDSRPGCQGSRPRDGGRRRHGRSRLAERQTGTREHADDDGSKNLRDPIPPHDILLRVREGAVEWVRKTSGCT